MIFLGEVMLPIQWVGGALIIASVILLQARQRGITVEPVPVGD